MTIVGVTCQMIFNRLMLQSYQLRDVAHDFRYDPCIQFVCMYVCFWSGGGGGSGGGDDGITTKCM